MWLGVRSKNTTSTTLRPAYTIFYLYAERFSFIFSLWIFCSSMDPTCSFHRNSKRLCAMPHYPTDAPFSFFVHAFFFWNKQNDIPPQRSYYLKRPSLKISLDLVLARFKINVCHDPTRIPSKSKGISDKIQQKDENHSSQRKEEYLSAR